MDISEIKSGERQVDVLSPGKKEPIGLRIGILHINDPKLKKLKQRIRDENYRLEARGKSLKSADVEDNLVELTYQSMTSWEWYNPTGVKGDEGYDPDSDGNFRGAKPEFNKKNVVDVFEACPWLIEFIGQEVSDDSAFFQI